MFNIRMTTNLLNEKICSIHRSHSSPRMPFLNQESGLGQPSCLLSVIKASLLGQNNMNVNIVWNVSSRCITMLDTHIYLLSTWLMSQTCSIPSISHQIPLWQESFPCLCLVRGLRSLFPNITVNLILIMDPFNSWLYFHCQRHLVTLFGYDTPQFRQCGIFIHNTEAIPVPAIEPKKPNMLEDILQLLRFIKAYFYILVSSKSLN